MTCFVRLMRIEFLQFRWHHMGRWKILWPGGLQGTLPSRSDQLIMWSRNINLHVGTNEQRGSLPSATRCGKSSGHRPPQQRLRSTLGRFYTVSYHVMGCWQIAISIRLIAALCVWVDAKTLCMLSSLSLGQLKSGDV